MRLKYIVDEYGNFMIFSPAIHHVTAQHASFRHTRGECVGAGFVDISDGKITCFGHSESLNIKSRGDEDAEIIAEQSGLSLDK